MIRALSRLEQGLNSVETRLISWTGRILSGAISRASALSPVPLHNKPRKRTYKSARTDRLGAGWVTAPQQADQIVYSMQGRLRARSRDLYRNSDHGRRFIHLLKDNTVGPEGITLQLQIRDPDGKLDTLANQTIENGFSEWGSSEFCDASGAKSWIELQRSHVGTFGIDGEAITRILRGPDHGPFQFALQEIDPELLDRDLNQDLRNGNSIRMGIERDQYSRPIAYHFLDLKAAPVTWGSPTRKHTRIAAADIIHTYLAEFVGQTRGLPMMATAMYRLKNLARYEDAALTNAIIGANKVGFFTQTDDDGGGERKYTGTDSDTDGSQIADLEPGSWEELPPGLKPEPWSPEYPRGEFPDFVRQCLQSASAGLLTTYHSLTGDLEKVNFSSIRAGTQDQQIVWRALQQFEIDSFCWKVYRAWLQWQLLIQTLRVPAKGGGVPRPLKAERYRKYLQARWQGPRWPYVNPLQDIQAAAMAIENRISSRSQIIRDRGLDPETVWRELADEEQFLGELGLAVKPIGNPTASQGGAKDGK